MNDTQSSSWIQSVRNRMAFATSGSSSASVPQWMSVPEPLRPWGAWQWAFFAILAAACAFSRLYDLGAKSPMHDESLFLYYSFEQMYRVWNYRYMPILHGPLHMQLQVLTWVIFGHSDYTMRLSAALLGIAGFFVIRGLRRWLGEAGTWAALVLYTVSSGLTFYQRFYREDAPFILISLLIILCACHWYRTHSWRWLFGLVLSIVLLFCNKENCVILYFSGLTFLLFWAVQDLVQWLLAGKNSRELNQSPSGALPPIRFPNVVMLNLILWGFIALCISRMFEGFNYEASVVSAIGRDYPMRNVNSVKLLLGILPAGVDPQSVASLPSLERPSLWRAFYLGGFAITLVALWGIKRAIVAEAGHRELITRLWNGLARNAWWLVAALGFSLFLYLGIFTSWFKYPMGPFQIYKDTFAYWVGQHAQHRIKGAFHYHMVIMLIYELPAVLLVFGAWFFALGRTRWGRVVALPLLALFTFYFLVLFNSPGWEQFLKTPILDDSGKQAYATGKAMLDHVLHLDSGFHIYLIFFLSFFCVVLSWVALWRGEAFHAWLIWWFVTSVGGYSYAGEKVPWVGVNIMLPLVLLAASYINKMWGTPWVRRNALVFALLMGIMAVWNAKAMINACFRNAGDIRERVAYGHFSPDIGHHARALQAYVSRATIRPDWQRNHNNRKLHKEVRVLVKSDASVWPLYWYLRDIDYVWNPPDTEIETAKDKFQFLFLDPSVLQRFPKVRENYTIYEGRGTCFWVPQLVEYNRLRDIWLGVIPQMYLDLDAAKKTRIDNSKKEWDKLFQYMMFRDSFEPNNAPYPSVSSVNYVFCVRKDVDL